MIDADDSGSITVEEAAAFFNRFQPRGGGSDVPALNIKAMIGAVDQNNDGTVDLKEFQNAMKCSGDLHSKMDGAMKKLDWQRHFRDQVKGAAG